MPDMRPATERQKSYIKRLARDTGWGDDNLDDLSMEEASELIDELKDELGIYDDE